MNNRKIPPWIRSSLPSARALGRVESVTYAGGTSTVCREARCPNLGECYGQGTATFLILGDRCTRNCSFCAVEQGLPTEVNPHEPEVVARAVCALGLRHVVITSVTRDDLPDGGASAFAATVRAIRRESPEASVEVLIPDLQGSLDALDIVIEALPNVINHNMETVERLYPALRPGADYARSLRVLDHVRKEAPEIITKSGIMVGVGETEEELRRLMGDLAGVGCLVLTVGQYLRPTPNHYPVQKFVPPDEFQTIEAMALSAGFYAVAAGPLVRSSYRAGELMERCFRADPPLTKSPQHQ
jgi:lipoyl synthase